MRIAGFAISGALLVLWVVLGWQCLVAQPDMTMAFVYLNAWIIGIVAAWDWRSRSGGGLGFVLLLFGPVAVAALFAYWIRDPRTPILLLALEMAVLAVITVRWLRVQRGRPSV